MRKIFSWVPELLSNTKISISLEGWPGATAVVSFCTAGLGSLYLLLKGGVLQRLWSGREDD